MSALSISVGIEKSEIRDVLNASIFGVFLMGMYTVIYFGTMYIYHVVTKNSSKRRIVPATLTMLFLCNIVQIGLQWYITKWQFVDNGGTRDSLFVSFFIAPTWVYIALDSVSYTSFVLADGLLIWRCFFVWDRSLRIISVPLLFLVSEIALFSTLFGIRVLYGGVFNNAALLATNNNLSCAVYFVVSVGSLITTALIVNRIYFASEQGTAVRGFKRIISMVVESGAVYSLCLLVVAVGNAVPETRDPLNTTAAAFNNYVAALLSSIPGLAATILVARVSMLPTNATFPSTSIHLSGLQFHARSTHHTDTPDVEGSYSAGVNRDSVDEGLQGNKAQ